MIHWSSNTVQHLPQNKNIRLFYAGSVGELVKNLNSDQFHEAQVSKICTFSGILLAEPSVFPSPPLRLPRCCRFV